MTLHPSSTHLTAFKSRLRAYRNKYIGYFFFIRRQTVFIKEAMPSSRRTWNQALSLLFILPSSLIAAFPSEPKDPSPVLAGRDSDTVGSIFDPQTNQDGPVTDNLIAELFPTGETTSGGNLEDTLLGYGDGNAELISADPTKISRCGQNSPSGKGRLKRQNNDICLPNTNQANPGAVEQKPPVKDQVPGTTSQQGQEKSPGLDWYPFGKVRQLVPTESPTNNGKCGNPEYFYAVCFAPWRSTVPLILNGLVVSLLDPVSPESMSTLIISYETRRRESWRILVTA